MEASSPRNSDKDAYEFGPIVGHGAYSYVRQCTRKGSSEALVAKIIEKQLVNQEKKLDQVMAESRTLKRLAHPNIVKYAGSFRDKKDQSQDENAGFFYIVMEHLQGGELAATVHRMGALAADNVRFIVAELLSALDFLHQMGLVHRDLKPENVMFDSGGHAKLVDFGCVKAVSEDQTDTAMEALFEQATEISEDSAGDELQWARTARELAQQLQHQSRGLARYEMVILGDTMQRLHAAKEATVQHLERLVALVASLPAEEEAHRLAHGLESSGLGAEQLAPLQLALAQHPEAAAACTALQTAAAKRRRCSQLARDTAWRQRREYDRAAQMGTQEYLAPELVTKLSRASRSSDLWALGCLSFQLLTGALRSPFCGPTDYLTQQKIIACEYEWPVPELLDCHGVLFARGLLQEQPSARAGCQAPAALWGDPFLACVDQSALCRTIPPPLQGNQPVSAVTRPHLGRDRELALPGEALAADSEEGSRELKKRDELEQGDKERWAQFMLPDEEIILCGVLRKRAHMFSNPERRFLLTQMQRNDRTLSRLLYIDEKRMVQRGEVPWSAATKAEQLDAVAFEIRTPKMLFRLEDPGGRAGQWVRDINRLAAQCPQRGASDPRIEEDEDLLCAFCR